MPYTRTFENARPPRRYDGLPFVDAVIRESATEGSGYSTIETFALEPVDTDPATPASRDFTTDLATLAAGYYVIRWTDEAGAIFDADPLYFPASSSSGFATVEEVAARLGRALTAAETAQVGSLLDGIDQLIRAEVGKGEDWDPDPVPGALRELSIQKAIAGMTNPSNVAATSIAIGSFSESQTFPRAQDGGVFLTAEEGSRMRFAVYGTNSASARQRSAVDQALDYADDGQINDSLGS